MFRPVLVFSLLLSLFLTSSAQTCSKYSFPSNQVFSFCNDLPYLSSFLYWNYNSSSGSLQIAFRRTGASSSTWAAWAINPSGSGMVGSQALVAYQQSNGTMRAYTSQITSYGTTLPEANLVYDVSGLTATYANSEIIIYATLSLPSNTTTATTINQVWQEGPVSNDSPQGHSLGNANTNSKGTLNLVSGQTAAGGGAPHMTEKNVSDKNLFRSTFCCCWFFPCFLS